MAATCVGGSVLPDQLVELFAGNARDDFPEANVQVVADETLQVIEFQRRGNVR